MTYHDNRWKALYYRDRQDKIVLEEVYLIHDHTEKDRKEILTPPELQEITECIEAYEQDRENQERAEADSILMDDYKND